MTNLDETDKAIAVLEPADAPQGLQQLFWSYETHRRRFRGWTPLGRGAFGTEVVKTFCNPYGHEIALKIIPQYDEDQLIRFQREIFNVRQLDSPNIVKIFGADAPGPFFVIEMELILGPTLEQDLADRKRRGEPYTLAEALDVAIDVASALIEAHSHDLIHRDIKPSNILLPAGRRPIAKLADFGVSRFLDAARLTQTGCSPGTPKFWAPEVCAGKPHTPASDVYSFVACLYLMLSGNQYFYEIHADPSPTTYAEAAKNQTPIPITAFNKVLPEELIGLITRGLDKNPDTRPTVARAREILTSLRERIGRSDAPAVPASTASPAAPASARYLLAGAGLAAAMALVAGLAVGRRSVAVLATDARATAGPVTSASRPLETAAPAVLEKNPFHVELDQVSAIVTNVSGRQTPPLRFVLVTADGTEHTGELPTLLVDEDVALALDGFVPPVHLGTRSATIEARLGSQAAIQVTLPPAHQ